VESFSERPSEGKPKHDANEKGGQKASNCAERIVPGIMADCYSAAGVPRQARENKGRALFYLVRAFWIRSRSHISMTSRSEIGVDLVNDDKAIPWRALIYFNATIALVNDGALSLIAFGRCAESAHDRIPVRARSPRSRGIRASLPCASSLPIVWQCQRVRLGALPTKAGFPGSQSKPASFGLSKGTQLVAPVLASMAPGRACCHGATPP
jgi:hypothetical protein